MDDKKDTPIVKIPTVNIPIWKSTKPTSQNLEPAINMIQIKAENLAKAIRMLPNAKTYTPETVFVMVDKVKYAFYKQNKEWYYDHEKSAN